MSTSARLDTSAAQLAPGGEVVIPLQIRNNGEDVEGYELQVVGPPSAWATVDPPTVSLYPDTSITATVSFHPPRSSDVPAGEQQYGVVVTPTDHPDDAVVPEGVLEILPFLETTAELQPRTTQGPRTGRHRLAIDNRGNIPIRVTLTGADDRGLLKVRMDPDRLDVDAGTTEFVKVRARPDRLHFGGQPLTHPYEVTVSPADSPPVVLPATYVQQPLIPKWLPKLLVGLVALAVLLAALWFYAVKPAAEKAAKEAVEPQLAAAKNSAQDAKDSAGDAKDSEEVVKNVTNPSAGANPSKKPTPVKPVPPPVSVSENLSTRSEAGDSDSATYTVPEKKRVELTDFVFSNPQGDFGRLVVTMAGTELFDMSLENFRDLDYHFVTPIRATADDVLTFEVECAAPGTPPNRPAPQRCNNSMTIGGEEIKLQPQP